MGPGHKFPIDIEDAKGEAHRLTKIALGRCNLIFAIRSTTDLVHLIGLSRSISCAGSAITAHRSVADNLYRRRLHLLETKLSLMSVDDPLVTEYHLAQLACGAAASAHQRVVELLRGSDLKRVGFRKLDSRDMAKKSIAPMKPASKKFWYENENDPTSDIRDL